MDRSRRLHRNDTENLPPFMVAGYLFVLTDPEVWVAHLFFFDFVVLRATHFLIYATARSHEMRGTIFTPASLTPIGMGFRVLRTALRAL